MIKNTTIEAFVIIDELCVNSFNELEVELWIVKSKVESLEDDLDNVSPARIW